MQGYNLVIVYSEDCSNLLMCKRLKEPYLGLSNFVGGKIEPGEDGMEAAYRELWEETAITKEDIQLHHLMDFTYYYQDCYVEAYVGRLRHPVNLRGEENTLYWSDFQHNFFDSSLYAGEGNIGHLLEQVELYRNELLN